MDMQADRVCSRPPLISSTQTSYSKRAKTPTENCRFERISELSQLVQIGLIFVINLSARVCVCVHKLVSSWKLERESASQACLSLFCSCLCVEVGVLIGVSAGALLCVISK